MSQMSREQMYFIKIGSRTGGPEASRFGLSDDLWCLRRILSQHLIKEPSIIRIHLFFELGGSLRNPNLMTRVRRCVTYKDGHCSIEIDVSLDSLKSNYLARRKEVVDLINGALPRLFRRISGRWPDWNPTNSQMAIRQSLETWLLSQPPKESDPIQEVEKDLGIASLKDLPLEDIKATIRKHRKRRHC